MWYVMLLILNHLLLPGNGVQWGKISLVLFPNLYDQIFSDNSIFFPSFCVQEWEGTFSSCLSQLMTSPSDEK